MQVETGNGHIGNLAQKSKGFFKSAGLVAEAEASADLAHRRFAGAHFFQIEVGADTDAEGLLRAVRGQIHKPAYLLHGVQVDDAPGLQNGTEGLFAFVRPVIDDLVIAVAHIPGQAVFVFRHYFGESASFFHIRDKPGQGVGLKGIADQVIVPVFGQGSCQHVVVMRQNRFIYDKIGRMHCLIHRVTSP